MVCGDDIRRQQLYDSQLFVHSARPSILALASFARSMIEDAFGGLDPQKRRKKVWSRTLRRYSRQVEASIHSPFRIEASPKGIMEELSGGPEKTYFDVPRMRSTHAIGANR